MNRVDGDAGRLAVSLGHPQVHAHVQLQKHLGTAPPSLLNDCEFVSVLSDY